MAYKETQLSLRQEPPPCPVPRKAQGPGLLQAGLMNAQEAQAGAGQRLWEWGEREEGRTCSLSTLLTLAAPMLPPTANTP